MSSLLVPDPERRRSDVLGIGVDLLTESALTEAVFATEECRPRLFANVNLHALYLVEREPQMRDVFARAHIVHIDGMAVVWLCRLLGYRAAREHRVTYIDWQPKLLARAEQVGWSVFFLGGAPGIGDRAAELLTARYPALRFGHHHGYFTPGESERVFSLIDEFRPQLFFVGMGMPRQEKWIAKGLDRFPPCAILPCGASFDYLVGEVPTPPRVLGQMGLEWCFRLLADPRRMWRRYLLEPIMLAPRVFRSVLRANRTHPHRR